MRSRRIGATKAFKPEAEDGPYLIESVIKLFYKSQFPQKPVNLSFMMTNIKQVDGFVRKLTFAKRLYRHFVWDETVSGRKSRRLRARSVYIYIIYIYIYTYISISISIYIYIYIYIYLYIYLYIYVYIYL